MAEEIAAARAGLRKSTVDNHKPTPSTNDMFVSKGKDEAAGDVRGQERLKGNGLDRVAEDKNAVSDEHDFTDARSRLKKTSGARPAAEKPAVKEGRLTNNGLDRATEDKNAVGDEHDFTDARARLKKASGARPAAENPAVKEGRLTSNGLDRATEDKNAVGDEHDFMDAKARLKKTASAPAMKQAKAPEKDGRLVSNGMDREAEDKNKVTDEFDFANLRANLKKPGAKTSDKKVAEAKARTPGQTEEAIVSNQMFVSTKAEPKAAGDVRLEKADRLCTNGMDRAADDRNAVSDEHNFANLRANLRKTTACA